MHIFNTWLFILFLSFISLVSTSIVPCVTPSTSPDQVTINAANYGYKGPGIYRIISFYTALTIGINNPSGGPPGAVRPVTLLSPSDDEAQHWQIEEVEQGRVTFTTVDSIGPFSLFNNGHGQAISAAAVVRNDPRTRWFIDHKTWSHTLGSPVLLYAANAVDSVLEISDPYPAPGTDLYVRQVFEFKLTKHAWLLERLGEDPESKVKTAVA